MELCSFKFSESKRIKFSTRKIQIPLEDKFLIPLHYIPEMM